MLSISRKKQVKNRPYLHLEEEIRLAHAFLDTWHQMRRLLQLHLLLLTLFYLYHDHTQVQHDHAPSLSMYLVRCGPHMDVRVFQLIIRFIRSNSVSISSSSSLPQMSLLLGNSNKNLAASSAVYLLDTILTHTTTFHLQNAKIRLKNDPKLVEKLLRTLC